MSRLVSNGFNVPDSPKIQIKFASVPDALVLMSTGFQSTLLPCSLIRSSVLLASYGHSQRS